MSIDRMLEAGTSALNAGTQKLQVNGNNIALLAGIATKSSTLFVSDSFSETLRQSAASSGTTGSNTAAAQIGVGVKVGSIVRDYGQGALQSSNAPSHLAIEGRGWFQVVNSINGDKFATRDGSFRVDDHGNFATKDGYRLQGSIVAPATEPSYTVDEVNGELVFTLDTPGTGSSTIGDLSVKYELSVGSGITKAVGTTFTFSDAQIAALAPRLTAYAFNEAGQLQIQLSDGTSFTRGNVLLMQFKDEQGLMSKSGGLFEYGGASLETFSVASKPQTGALGAIKQNMLEGSNVDLTHEFAEIISGQKYVQAAARIITTADSVLQEIVSLKR